MNIRSVRAGMLTLVTAGALTLGGLSVAAPASASPGTALLPAAGACESWNDNNTFGGACGGYPGLSYRAAADCENGKSTYGAWRSGTSWQWSYAYCTSVGSSLSVGWLQWK